MADMDDKYEVKSFHVIPWRAITVEIVYDGLTQYMYVLLEDGGLFGINLVIVFRKNVAESDSD